MRELTMGERRNIAEAANGWKMEIYTNSEQPISKEKEDRIEQMATAYTTSYLDYYKNAVAAAADGKVNAVAVANAFNEMYKKEHPDFFDMDALIKEV